MSCDFYALATGAVRTLKPYRPGKPLQELEREYGIKNAVKLASNENPLGPSPRVLEALRAATDKTLALYPDAGGYDLKQALAAELGVKPEQITLGNGSNDVLDLVARTFVGPQHAIMYAQYAFLVYPIVTQIIGAQAIEVPARDWGCDLPAMLAALTPYTRLIFVANPNNPTGTHFDAAALETFLAGVPEQVIVVLDEAYAEYIETPDYPDGLRWLERYPNLVVTRTFSKAYGLAGLRVGYAVSHPQVADLLNRVRQPFNVSSLALLGALSALQDKQHLAQGVELNRRGLRQLSAGFERLGLDYIPSLANFICVDTGRSGPEVYEALLRHGVIVRPVENYGLPTHLRVSVGLERENQQCLDALRDVLGA